MNNPLARKLQNFVRLTDADRLWLDWAVESARRIDAGADIVLEGDDPRTVDVVLDGWAYSHKQFEDGRRQILSFQLPGDACDPHVFLLRRTDRGLSAITPVTLARIPGGVMREIRTRSTVLDDAFHIERLAAAAIQREWTASLGRRSATERVAHLLCELHLRLCAVGLADGPNCPMPLTQVDLADALGQTSVHINRMLQDLRNAGLIVLKGRRLTILDQDGLRRLAGFDPAYLHFEIHEASAGR